MRWFVSRELYETMRDNMAQQITDLRTQLAREQDRYAALASQLLANAQPKVLPEKQKDPVSEAITLKAGMNGQLRAHLGRYARTARAEQTEDEAIVEAIMHWQSSDESGLD